jgi:predicted TPR repeat methyltransferase
MSNKKDPNDLGLQTAYGYKKSSDLQRFYDDTANGYDNYIKETGYALPYHLVDYLRERTQLNGMLILDVGCGSGLLGELINKECQSSTIEGVDFSIEMLNIAGNKKVDPFSPRPDAGKQIYRSLVKADLTIDHGIIAELRYDILVSAGVFTTGHLGFEDLVNLLPCIKSGGRVCITVKKNVYEDDQFQKRLTTAVCAGVISEFSTQVVDIYENDVYNDQSLILYFTKI